MNCKEMIDLLSSGAPLTAEARAHLAACPDCKAMLDALNERPPAVTAARVAAIEHQILSGLTPVRVLPSNRALTLTVFAVALVLAIVCAFPFGYLAVRSLSVSQMAVYYGLITALAALFATAIAQDMVPGAKRTVHRGVLAAAAFLSLAAAVIVLFPSFAAPQFVARGISCLRLGTLSAVIAGFAIWVVLRRGFLTTPVETCGVAGTFAGLVGFAVLALHCPIEEVPHILTWHLGAMAIAGCAGALIGGASEWLGRFRKPIA